MTGLFIGLALLALSGGALSYYFLQVYRRKLAPDVWWIPPVCRVGRNSCEAMVETPYGRTFGMPNAFWGCLFYPVLFAVVLVTWLAALDRTILLALSVAMVSVSLYLTWGLLSLKTVCAVCIAVHIINLLFLALVLIERLS